MRVEKRGAAGQASPSGRRGRSAIRELLARASRILSALLWLFIMAVTTQVIAYFVLTVAVPHVPVLLTSCLLLLQPLLGVAVAAAVVGEHPSHYQLGGAALIILGIALAMADHRAAAAGGEAGPLTASGVPDRPHRYL